MLEMTVRIHASCLEKVRVDMTVQSLQASARKDAPAPDERSARRIEMHMLEHESEPRSLVGCQDYSSMVTKALKR